jgi:hypothetical protein
MALPKKDGGDGLGAKCPYCDCSEAERGDVGKLAGWKLFSKTPSAFINPLLSMEHVPIQNVVVCTLHMRLRNADYLLRLLVQRCTKLKGKKRDQCEAAIKAVADRHGLNFMVRLFSCVCPDVSLNGMLQMTTQIYFDQRNGGKFKANSVNGRTAEKYLAAAPEFFTEDIFGAEAAKAREAWSILSKLQFLIEGKDPSDPKKPYDKGWREAMTAWVDAKKCLRLLNEAFFSSTVPVYVHILLSHGAQLIGHVRSSVLSSRSSAFDCLLTLTGGGGCSTATSWPSSRSKASSTRTKSTRATSCTTLHMAEAPCRMR